MGRYDGGLKAVRIMLAEGFFDSARSTQEVAAEFFRIQMHCVSVDWLTRCMSVAMDEGLVAGAELSTGEQRWISADVVLAERQKTQIADLMSHLERTLADDEDTSTN